MAEKEQGNIKQEYNVARVGLDMDHSPMLVSKGAVTYALNANVENYDANGVSYGNEEGNNLCLTFPETYLLIGKHFIPEQNKHIFFLATLDGANSQIGYMDNNDCQYKVLVNSPCLNFSKDYPIHKVAHKNNNCGTEIYWTDGLNPRRYLDIDDIPKILKSGSPLCSPMYTDDVDCNQLKLQSDFSIPSLEIVDVVTTGNLVSGAYQFAVQYSDASGNPYTSYYSVTNPTPIFDDSVVSINFNTPVGKSIIIQVGDLDVTGQFQYFNIAVIKTTNGISSVELIGTYFIDSEQKNITYTGQIVDNIRLSINDIFEKYPYYEVAEDLTTIQDVLVWSGLTSEERLNYQGIASKIELEWETWRIPSTEDYSNELNATNLRSYLRDEVYSFEFVPLLKSGKQVDGFHIPGRKKNENESSKPDVPESSLDFIGTPDYYSGGVGYKPYWKIYNTASVSGFSTEYSPDSNYKGPYQHGEFAYWESTEEYPCNAEVWGELAGQKIRHHKFPDVLISPIHEAREFTSLDNMEMGNTAIFPIGVYIDTQQIQYLINASSLTQEQKDDIIGYKIVRGDRGTNKSIVAKGILRNVGKYEREDQEYYYPNYPYNDLGEDPFLNASNNAFDQLCNSYEINITQLQQDPLGGAPYARVQYTDCNTNKSQINKYDVIGIEELCSITKPIILAPAAGTTGLASYETWTVRNNATLVGIDIAWEDPVYGYKEKHLCPNNSLATCDIQVVINTVIGTGGPKKTSDDDASVFIALLGTHYSTNDCSNIQSLSTIRELNDGKIRQVFNSPETSFGQPFLGNVLKMENVMYGTGKAHFTEVKDNAKYRLITEQAQIKALESSELIAGDPPDATAMFTAYQAYLQIYLNGITRKNYAYSFNSIADYTYGAQVQNQGNKQREIDVARYLIPGVQSIAGDRINNYQRETSVYLKTNESIHYPDELLTNNLKEDSRFTISEVGNCSAPSKEEDIKVVSYYASLKNEVVNQWGQIYSYDTIDTGFQQKFDNPTSHTIFGGDTFIGKFAFKTKLPFFIDNRVGAPDDSDIFYDEIGNIAYPKYWHSARSILKDYTTSVGTLSNIISYKAHNFDCPNDSFAETISTDVSTTTTSTTFYAPPTNPLGDELTFYDGYFYLFAYGVPSFYCESSYNLDLRQAFNNKEGEFWPHVSSGIPDDWVQESFVPIAQDNTYYYNTSFSKQNKENTFTHLPFDWNKTCYTTYPFRAIYSDQQYSGADNNVNNWRVYKALSYFDFPQNNGRLTSLDGIQNKAILARFENKTLLYGNLLTMDTSNPQMAYLGNPKLFEGAPPIDFAETDLGYVGCQNKMLLKIPQGQITIDAKRGQVFLIQGTQITDLSAFGSGMNRFFTDHLAFEILRYFPEVDTDNNFTGVGLHAVYDSKYDRVIITKLDYIPIDERVKYENGEYYIEKVFPTNQCNLQGIAVETNTNSEFPHVVTNSTDTIIREKVDLTDTTYFCNKSWTLSFNMNTKSWISFHSYLPNFYIAENNFFYSGLNDYFSPENAFELIGGTQCILDVEILNNTTTTTTTQIPN